MSHRRVIVDGMNVIGSRADGWWRDRPSAMRSLVELLAARAPVEHEALTVVFDGRPFELEEREGVEVLFARRSGRNAADDDIVALVRASDSPAELTVVTSDDDLARRVRTLGAEVASAGAFRRRLDRL
jgi:predicted RNA-binding protein with PIN domain